MVPSIVVLGTQIQNIKMRFTKLIIKSIAQRVMANSSFVRRFHDLKYLEVGIFSFILLEFIINLRTPLQNFANKNHLNVLLSCFEQI